MIGKVAKMGTSFSSVLAYCLYGRSETNALDRTQIRGELIYAQGVDELIVNDPTIIDGDMVQQYGVGKRLDVGALAQQLQDGAARQPGLTAPVWHQMFSFPIGEDPTTDQLDSLIGAWQQTFGFTQNQLVVFRHRDKDHQHIHLVGNRIDGTGVNTSLDAFNYRETGRLCRRMEAALQLTPVAAMHHDVLDGRYGRGHATHHDRLRHLIDEALPKSTTVRELSHKLHRDGVSTIVGRGITFVDKHTGVKTKGSELGRTYSLANLTARLTDGTSVNVHEMGYQVPSKQAKAFAGALDEGLTQTSNWPALQLFLIAQRGFLMFPGSEGKAWAPGKTMTPLLGVFRAGQLRTMPVDKLGEAYAPTVIQARLARNPAILGLTEKVATGALAAAQRAYFRAALLESVRYAQHMTGKAASGRASTTAWLQHLDTHSAWQVDCHVDQNGQATAVDFNLRGDKDRAGDRAGGLLAKFTQLELADVISLTVAKKAMNISPTVGPNQELSSTIPSGANPNKVESIPGDIYAQGGAQMDRDTKADLAEIQRSLQQMKTGRKKVAQTQPLSGRKGPKRRL